MRLLKKFQNEDIIRIIDRMCFVSILPQELETFEQLPKTLLSKITQKSTSSLITGVSCVHTNRCQ